MLRRCREDGIALPRILQGSSPGAVGFYESSLSMPGDPVDSIPGKPKALAAGPGREEDRDAAAVEGSLHTGKEILVRIRFYVFRLGEALGEFHFGRGG
jgi:hypothetical protein